VSFAELGICAAANHGSRVDKSVVPHSADAIRQRRVISGNYAAFTRVDDFGRVKAEYFGIPESSQTDHAVAAAKRMGGIEQERKVVTAGDILQFLDGTRASPNMDSQDGAGLLSNQGFNARRINAMGLGIDVAEYGTQAQPFERVSCADEGKRGENDLTAKIQRPGDQLKSGCGIRTGYGVGNAQVLADAVLEFMNGWSIVGQPSRSQHAPQSSKE
jgi:hypothetical protein